MVIINHVRQRLFSLNVIARSEADRHTHTHTHPSDCCTRPQHRVVGNRISHCLANSDNCCRVFCRQILWHFSYLIFLIWLIFLMSNLPINLFALYCILLYSFKIPGVKMRSHPMRCVASRYRAAPHPVRTQLNALVTRPNKLLQYWQQKTASLLPPTE